MKKIQLYWPYSGDYDDINQPFGANTPFILDEINKGNGNPYAGWAAGHCGLDYGRRMDNKGDEEDVVIRATHKGTVSRVDHSTGGFGELVVVMDETQLIQTYYAHMRENTIKVVEKQPITPGQELGIMGTTGNSTGVHLHFALGILTPALEKDGPFNEFGERITANDWSLTFRQFINPLGTRVEWYFSLAKVCFPFGSGTGHKPESPLKYYFNAENSGGGYFPVGLSRTLHGGVHLYPVLHLDNAKKAFDILQSEEMQAEDEDYEENQNQSGTLNEADGAAHEVKSMAPGYIVAARINSRKTSLEENENDILRKFINNYTGFVLVRHDIQFDDGTENPLYSLYMHLAPAVWQENGEPRDLLNAYNNIDWMKNIILRQNKAVIKLLSPEEITAGSEQEDFYTLYWLKNEYDDTIIANGVVDVRDNSGKELTLQIFQDVESPAGTNPRRILFFKDPPADIKEAFNELTTGAVITFSSSKNAMKPYLTVNAGDLLGYVQAKPGESKGFLHWEVFSTREEDTVNAIINSFTSCYKNMKNVFITLEDTISNGKSDNYLQKSELLDLFNKYNGLDKDNLEKIKDAMNSDSDSIQDAYQRSIMKYRNELIHFYDELRPYEIQLEMDVSEIHEDYHSLPLSLTGDSFTHNLTISDFANDAKVKIEIPPYIDNVVIVSDACNITTVNESDEGIDDYLKQLLNQKMRNIIFDHKTEWSPVILGDLLARLYDEGFLDMLVSDSGEVEETRATLDRHFLNLQSIPWYKRPEKYKQASEMSAREQELYKDGDEFGEVPVLGDRESGKEISLFRDSSSPLNSEDIINMHPVTAVFILYSLLTHESPPITFKPPEEFYTGEGDNFPVECIWYFVNTGTKKLTLSPLIGQDGRILVIGENYRNDPDQELLIQHKESDLNFSLGNFQYDINGVYDGYPFLQWCLWGKWQAGVKGSDFPDNSDKFDIMTVIKPSLKAFRYSFYFADNDSTQSDELETGAETPGESPPDGPVNDETGDEEAQTKDVITVNTLKYASVTVLIEFNQPAPLFIQGFLYIKIEGESFQWDTLHYGMPLQGEVTGGKSQIRVNLSDLITKLMENKPGNCQLNDAIEASVLFLIPNGGFFLVKEDPDLSLSQPLESSESLPGVYQPVELSLDSVNEKINKSPVNILSMSTAETTDEIIHSLFCPVIYHKEYYTPISSKGLYMFRENETGETLWSVSNRLGDIYPGDKLEILDKVNVRKKWGYIYWRVRVESTSANTTVAAGAVGWCAYSTDTQENPSYYIKLFEE